MYSKYKNTKVFINGVKIDSKKEAKRLTELELLQKAGKIKDLQKQVKYELQPKYKLNKKTIREISYIADFVYYDIDKKDYVIEDVKGYRTDLYKLKKKMFMYKYQKEITEV